MKNFKDIFAILIVLSFSFYVGCKNDNGSDPEPDFLAEKLEELMNGGSSWTMNSVTKDGYDVSDQFTGFVLTVGEYTYSTQNSLSSAWPSSGTWKFNDTSGTVIKRDDGTLISVSISGTQLTLSFTATGVTGGRKASVDGDYVFVLGSQ